MNIILWTMVYDAYCTSDHRIEETSLINSNSSIASIMKTKSETKNTKITSHVTKVCVSRYNHITNQFKSTLQVTGQLATGQLKTVGLVKSVNKVVSPHDTDLCRTWLFDHNSTSSGDKVVCFSVCLIFCLTIEKQTTNLWIKSVLLQQVYLTLNTIYKLDKVSRLELTDGCYWPRNSSKACRLNNLCTKLL
jgi:hypothetical protein|uniref:Uncharacterized protein n=1 Tax=Zea mays TaxID=4577 RepID=A0A804PL92_MAIZE